MADVTEANDKAKPTSAATELELNHDADALGRLERLVMQSKADETTDNTIIRWDSATLKRLQETPLDVARERYERMLFDGEYQSEHRMLHGDDSA